MTPTTILTARPTRRAAAFAVAAALAGAACGGGDEAAAPTIDDSTTAPSTAAPTTLATTTTTTTDAPATTPRATTSSEARAGSDRRRANREHPRRQRGDRGRRDGPTTTTVPELRRVPLTGHPLGKGEHAPDRPAMVVKIDNVGRGRPQTGLNQADIVFEEIVEGRATRFAAVFHSQGSNPVGPIRSGRTQDVDLLSGLNQPLFVWSGGNPGVVAAIESSDFLSLNATGRLPASGFFRTDRPAPHNLYNNTDPLWAQMGWALGRPDPLFDYLEPGEEARGDLRAWADVRIGGNHVRWEWDPGTRTYLRSQNGAPHGLTDGWASANTVVVLVTGYRPSYVDARSPEAITVGRGLAFVLTAGHYEVGVWERADRTAPIAIETPKGDPIEIVPGRTWVQLVDAADHSTVTG